MILNRSCFNTRIGKLDYLWLQDEEGLKVAALGLGEAHIIRYISELKEQCKDPVKILIDEKRFPLLEKSVTGFLHGRSEYINIKPVFLKGTEFEKRVWNETSEIPFGWTCSYGELAALCGKPGAGRAVGNAMGKNPVLLVVPCHRIIKGDGSLGGFGARPDLKRELLVSEGIKIR
jgi:O-6-methylguanine DNA methyltransferase